MSKSIQIGIVQFPGSNTERETNLAIRRAGMEPIEILWNDPVDKIHACDGYIIIGGFSFEDRSRAGVIASLEPIMQPIRSEAEAGKPVLGICNGAQILVETGLVPGLDGYRPGLALTDNRRIKDGHVMGTGYYNTWANLQLSVPGERCAFTRNLNIGDWITIPLAHAEGRFVTNDDILGDLINNDQTVFRYCDERGNIQSEFPVNPNGSLYNLAAVCNSAGNVMSLMPHPERTVQGDSIFTSMRDFIDARPVHNYRLLPDKRPKTTIKPFVPAQDALELTVELIITDNTAVSVRNALKHLDLPVQLTRHTHWEVSYQDGDPQELLDKITASGELFNSNKERLIKSPEDNSSTRLLVRSHKDVLGQQKLEMLSKRFELSEISAVRYGVIWTIIPEQGASADIIDDILSTHILFNPLAHNCYYYQNE